MVINLASRSASRMINSYDLRRISARSRGLRPAQPSKASLAASTAAFASSAVALATEAILFSVAGSSTSKRPPSEALRHLPPIHRSVGTLARRFSYMVRFPILVARRERSAMRKQTRRGHLHPGFRFAPSGLRIHRSLHAVDDAVDGGQRDVLQYVGRGEWN